MDPSRIREKIGRFRILIIGRANAGKTTILQRVCNTRDNPEIRNCAGELINPALLEASRERGEHDIENEMVFQSNPGFVFHDSRGFEAGGESEFNQVKAFIARRSKEAKLKDQLHAIWYCIPMDEACRSFTKGEVKFFSQCDTGSIPVIVLFTKFDALYDVEFAQLTENGTPWKDAKELAPTHAEESFAKGPQLKFLYHSKDIRHPPKCHVCLPNMNEDDADCRSLMERTAGTLDNEVLQQLFVSTQQANLELCMKYAIERMLQRLLDSAETIPLKDYQDIVGQLGSWFPHILVDDDYDRPRDPPPPAPVWWPDRAAAHELDIDFRKTDVLNLSNREEMQSRILAVASGSSPLENIVQLSSAAVIIFEHSFYIFDKQRYLQHQEKSVPSFNVALEQYMASPHAGTVKEAVSTAIQAYEEAVTAATHAYQGKLPAWMANFEPFKRKAKQSFGRSQAKAKFIETILKITLDHRLRLDNAT